MRLPHIVRKMSSLEDGMRSDTTSLRNPSLGIVARNFGAGLCFFLCLNQVVPWGCAWRSSFLFFLSARYGKFPASVFCCCVSLSLAPSRD